MSYKKRFLKKRLTLGGIWLYLEHPERHNTMKHFYRIEHRANHLGPYNNYEYDCDENFSKVLDRTGEWNITWALVELFPNDVELYNDDRCPPPPRDKIKNFDYDGVSDLRFGFASPKKLFNWFSRRRGVYKLLLHCGFEVVRYDLQGDRMDGLTQSCVHEKHLTKRKVMTKSWIFKQATI